MRYTHHPLQTHPIAECQLPQDINIWKAPLWVPAERRYTGMGSVPTLPESTFLLYCIGELTKAVNFPRLLIIVSVKHVVYEISSLLLLFLAADLHSPVFLNHWKEQLLVEEVSFCYNGSRPAYYQPMRMWVYFGISQTIGWMICDYQKLWQIRCWTGSRIVLIICKLVIELDWCLVVVISYTLLP